MDLGKSFTEIILLKLLGRNSADGFLNRQLNRVISKLTLVFIVIR